ncbi:MAG: winged helix-turn-helix transcriptional regulator [Promethearchaeota archaeon]
MKNNKMIRRESKTVFFLISFIILLSLNFYLNTVNARDVDIFGFSTNDSINSGETVNYHFSNNILLTISSNVSLDLDVNYDNHIQNKQIHFIINNSETLRLNITFEENFGNFGVSQPPQNPNRGSDQFQNKYNCIMLMISNVSIEYLTIRNIKRLQYGFSSNKQYSVGLYKPSSESWQIFNTIETLNTSNSELYLETSISNLNTSTEYYFTYFEVSNIIDNWIWASFFVILFTVVVAVVIVVSKSDYIQYLKLRTVPIEKGAHRLSLEDVLENNNRDKIIDFILKEPGIHFNELLRKTGLAAGNLVWHLDILETYKVVGKKRVGKFIAYFPYYQKNPISNIDLQLSKSKLTLEILEMIENEPGLWNNLITKKLKVDHKTIHYHINKLKELNLIRLEKDGRKRKFFPNLDSEYYSEKNNKEKKNNKE